MKTHHFGFRSKNRQIALCQVQIMVSEGDYTPQRNSSGTISVILTAVARKMFIAKNVKGAQNLAALIPRTRRCLTPVHRSYSDMVASTPARQR
jgi:uncharacterized alpha/beta hydrolase family protein